MPDLLIVKVLLDSVVSTPGAKFVTIDISNFYLNTPLDRYEYMKMKLSNFPDNIIELYIWRKKTQAMDESTLYGLPQAGILAQKC